MADNEFLPFGTTAGANVLAQALYSGLSARSTGFMSGVASSAQLNKVWRQSSSMAAMIGQFIADNSGNDADDDGDIATLLSNFELAATSFVGGNFVNKAGDTMTGALVLPGAPVADLQATTKKYVDDNFLSLPNGGTVNDQVYLPNSPTQDTSAVNRAYVDHPGYVGISGTTTLVQSQLRKYVECTGSGSYTVTLPVPTSGGATPTTGGYYLIYNAGSSDKTLSTPSGNFVGPSGSGASTLTLPRGAFTWVIAGFSNWVVLYQTYSYSLITGATTLSASALNGYVQLSGGSTYTVTLPDPSNFSGASLEIYNAGSIAYTLSTPGGNFVGPSGSGASTKSIAAGSYLHFRAGSANWITGSFS